MERTKKTPEKLSKQVDVKIKNNKIKSTVLYEGSDNVISTGCTLLDLAITGGRFEEGGIPTGILVEIFGPSGSGKTVLLSQLAGNMQRKKGKIMFHDPEARLNEQFAKIFGLDTKDKDIEYTIPDTIPELFQSVRKWIPKEKGDEMYGVFADSLAALSTDMEMDKEEGDKMGMRRAKEFSEELRKTCRIITQHNILMVCSNQIRQNLDSGPYGQRYKSPGGEAIGFYSSLRLRCLNAQKIKVKHSVRGKEYERIVGIKVGIEVFKSSVWKPYRTADVYIIFDYGIDDVRGNLIFLKTSTADTIYRLGEKPLGKSLEKAIRVVEDENLENELKRKVIELWREVEEKFQEPRKPKIQ
jgi:recombination protein RecA